MGIVEYIRVHYRKCSKEYFYLGILLIIAASLLLYNFWGVYTKETEDIRLETDGDHYPEYDDGDSVRIHGDISEIEYYGEPEPKVPHHEDLDQGQIDLNSQTFAGDLAVLDNISFEKKWLDNFTIRNVLFYDGKFSKSHIDNTTFENVTFIRTKFSKMIFSSVLFKNVSFIDSSIKNSEFIDVGIQGSYMREFEISESLFQKTFFSDSNLSRVDMNVLELDGSGFRDLTVNDSEFRGIRFLASEWLECTLYNVSLDVVAFNDHDFGNCSFSESTFRSLFIDHEDELDYTIVESGDVYIRLDGDLRNTYADGTSFYGTFTIQREEGNATAIEGKDIAFSYDIFQKENMHHSLRIEGVFYIIILCGMTSITYSFGGKAILMALVKFFLPFILSGIGILILYLALPYRTFETLGAWMILYFFPPLGKESVIPAAIAQGISPWLIAIAIAFIDIMVGLFLVWNFDLARKIPLVGGFIRRIESKGNEILAKKPWVERLAFTGIVLFVMFPFQGSGAVGATIVGRMLGMEPKKIWFAVILGALLGCFIIAYTSAYAITFLLGVGLAYAVLSIVIVVLFILVLYNYEKWGNWVREKFE